MTWLVSKVPGKVIKETFICLFVQKLKTWIGALSCCREIQAHGEEVKITFGLLCS